LTHPQKNKPTAEETGIEVLQDAFSIQELYVSMVRKAEKEISLLLPTTSSFEREKKIGLIKSLEEAAGRGVTVHVLTPSDDIHLQRSFGLQNIEVRRIRTTKKSESAEEPRTKILIVDSKEYLIVELKDDSKETFVEAVRLAIYSTTQSTVRAYGTLFESLWGQAELYDRLEEHDKMQKEFINIAAHELRTPIQPIIMLTQLLRPRLENGIEKFELTKKDYELLLRNSQRLDRLATDILEVSRIESHTIKLNKERFDMNEKIRNVIRDFVNIRRDLQFIQLLRAEPIMVEADKVRIFEVLSNLLRNAIKFTSTGMIVVKAQKVDGEVQVEVKDTGTGIDSDILPMIFEKFVTKSDQGTGLGLFISKNIIEAHGGRIWAENNKDENGATFRFTLPLT